MTWTDERVALLKKYWHEDGLSAAQVALRLGGFAHCKDGGRSAVIGKLHRLSGPERPARPKKPRTKARSRGSYGGLAKKLSHPKVPRPAKAPRPEPPKPPDCDPVTLMASKDHQCKFVIGDAQGPETLYCGDTAPAGPYCPYHENIAWQPYRNTKDRQRQAEKTLLGAAA